MGTRTAAYVAGAPALLLHRQRARPGGGAVSTRRAAAVRLRAGLHPHAGCRPSPGGWHRIRQAQESRGLVVRRRTAVPAGGRPAADGAAGPVASSRRPATGPRPLMPAASAAPRPRTSYRDVPDTAAQRALPRRRPAAGRRRGGTAGSPDSGLTAVAGRAVARATARTEAAIAPGADYGLQLPRRGRARPAGSGG